MFKLMEFNNSSFRSNMFSEQNICNWISIYGKNTNTSWYVKTLERNELSSNSTNLNILRNFSTYNILLKKLPTKSKKENPF
jgi:hypothetical protein